MENNGWICVHRKILDNPIVMKDLDHFGVWMYLLLNATHRDYPVVFKGKKTMLQPGQLITGRISISKALGINESKIRRVLDDFEIDHQIDRQRSNKSSLITILNWEKYQGYDHQSDQQVTNNRPTSDHIQQYNNDNNVNNIYAKKSPTPKRVNKFNNFDQRTYNFSELERQIVGRNLE